MFCSEPISAAFQLQFAFIFAGIKYTATQQSLERLMIACSRCRQGINHTHRSPQAQVWHHIGDILLQGDSFDTPVRDTLIQRAWAISPHSAGPCLLSLNSWELFGKLRAASSHDTVKKELLHRIPSCKRTYAVHLKPVQTHAECERQLKMKLKKHQDQQGLVTWV